jgi:hypothetical protein
LAIQVGLILWDKLDNDKEKIKRKVSLAFDYYMSTSSDDASAFMTKYCCPICIEFMGVWCVSNLLQFLDQADMID